jgi:hypothetical protein
MHEVVATGEPHQEEAHPGGERESSDQLRIECFDRHAGGLPDPRFLNHDYRADVARGG